MVKTITKIKSSKAREIRDNYNKLFDIDKDNKFFKEEQVQLLSNINIYHVVRTLVEYRSALHEISSHKKYMNHYLILKLEKAKDDSYYFDFYETDRKFNKITMLIKGMSNLSINEVEAFLYIHMKRYPNQLTKDERLFPETNAVCYSNDNECMEFLFVDNLSYLELNFLASIYNGYLEQKEYQKIKTI